MKTTIFACLLALIAVAGFAQTPSDAPASPAVLSIPSTAAGPAAPAEAIFAANRKAPVKALCTASCGGSSTVSCLGTTCQAADRDCSILERGHVTCNGITINCAKTCDCAEVCVCSVPCSEQCTSGGGFVQDCGSWGFCATSCACGGECLRGPDDPWGSSQSASGGACATPAETDILRSQIFN